MSKKSSKKIETASSADSAALKMSKKARREAAEKAAKRKKAFTITAVSVIGAGIIALVIFISTRPFEGRIYENGTQQIILYNNGDFRCFFMHGITKGGRYTIEDSYITFTTRNETVTGSISGNTLRKPVEWDDGHGHGLDFWLK